MLSVWSLVQNPAAHPCPRAPLVLTHLDEHEEGRENSNGHRMKRGAFSFAKEAVVKKYHFPIVLEAGKSKLKVSSRGWFLLRL